MRLFFVAATGLALSACDRKADEPHFPPFNSTLVAPPTTAPSPQAIPVPVPTRPAHYYDSRDGVRYYYVAAISENDRKAGKAAGNVHSFAYLGKRGAKHVLARLNGDGRVLEEMYCDRPCRVISYQDGSLFEYNENSVIGAAFADALAGRLEIAEYRPIGPPQPIAQPIAPSPAPSGKPDDREAGKLLLWLDANDKCLWSTNQAERDSACMTRDDVLGPSLTSAGYCFGREGEVPSNFDLHRCEGGSLPLPTLNRRR